MVVKTPPMGWNTWNTFGENINEKLIMESADAMVETGLKDAGYEYIVIDDCWSEKQRDASGRLQASRTKFPHGIKYLSDYIHSKGLKMGIYSCCGPLTCAGYPGSLDHEYADAKFFAENEIDFLKYDWCYHPRNMQGRSLYNRMGMALNATGRDILFSACNWGEENSKEWMRSAGADMYRSTYDISDNFDIIKSFLKEQKNNFALSAPSCFNDIDMLICGMYGKGNVSGNGGCTDDEYKTHFAIWCMVSSPLMIGCDIRNMNEATRSLLTDRELIRINQDEEVRTPIIPDRYIDSNMPVMIKHLANNEYAVSVSNFNEKTLEEEIILLQPEIGLSADGEYGLSLQNVNDPTDTINTAYVMKVHGLRAHETRVYRGKLQKMR